MVSLVSKKSSWLVCAVTFVLCVQWSANLATTTTTAPNNINSEEALALSLSRNKGKSLLLSSRHKPSPSSLSQFPSDSNSLLPFWLLEYSQWHTQQKQRLTPDNWNSQDNDTDTNRFLILTCLSRDKTCGGLSDRLQHIPAMVQLAARTRRLLLIYWQVPARLEEFLVPPAQTGVVGMDWRMPDWLIPKIFPAQNNDNDQQQLGCTILQKGEKLLDPSFSKAQEAVVCIRSSLPNYGQTLYDSWPDKTDSSHDPTFVQVYPAFWRFVFAPSPPIATRIQHIMDQYHLVPGHYVVAHARALYNDHNQGEQQQQQQQQRDLKRIQKLSRNAVHCAHRLVQRIQKANPQQQQHNAIPIYFASDSAVAIQTAVDYGKGTVVSAVYDQNDNNINVKLHDDTTSTTTLPQSAPSQQQQQPLHLDRATATRPSDYYDIFVDLYILGNARCVTYNVGGFGRWGAFMGFAFSNWNNNHTIQLWEPCWLEHHHRDCTSTKFGGLNGN